jgi:hypothetical protein
MRYTGSKYSQAEAEKIWAEARGHVAAPYRQDTRHGVSIPDFIVKTRENARIAPVPVPAPAPELPDEDDFHEGNFFFDVLAECIARLQQRFQAALEQRDGAIKALENRLDVEVGLGRKLAQLKDEIAEAQKRQPNFESELAALRAKVERQAKLITKLRGQTSGLEFGQTQLDAQLSKSRRQMAETKTTLTVFGQQTRTVLESLHEAGFDLVGDMEPLSRLPS